ncbi:hypothetical protein A2U01_0085158, partial [Trifolium medium]|nr:hypothetical protein [Trifolium medium]
HYRITPFSRPEDNPHFKKGRIVEADC